MNSMKKKIRDLTDEEMVEKNIAGKSTDCLSNLICDECPFVETKDCCIAVEKFFQSLKLDLEVEESE